MLEPINDDDIVITDENGNEQLCKILFYFHNDNRNKDYYFIFKQEDPDSIIVLSSEDGNSFQECSDEEFEEAQEVFEAYNEDPKIQQAKN
ncbi:MAG: DUF1292 domain-containing protein [Mollicutes bacterium]|nr:DUF1292 domain-containing protein [Mollicutes bacterium]MDD7715321.1 DUF1292 domain-containing protein [Mollicutes bacterium]MDY3904450.1 DUF1292 domain-containing protein [Candidatus Enteromonas sp.]MDY4936005.1 DUF1292 domain-containing protein [Candidatus Enteromonas sp.]